MGRVGRVGLAGRVAVAFGVTVAAASAQQPPRFQTSVDVTRIDVAVVDDHGKPITDLAPADFVVRVDGNTRRVVSAEWIPLATPETRATPPAPPPDGYSTNESASGGRLIVIAIDEPNIRLGGAMGIARAANAFIDRLPPADRIAVAGFGTGAPPTVFTADRARVKQAISRMAGQKRSNRINDLGHNIAVVEAMAIDRGDRATLDLVQQRECLTSGAGLAIVQLEMCRAQVEMEAHALAQEIIREGDQSIQALRDLFTGLRTIDAPKTMILISEGFVMNDEGLVIELGRMAAEARTSVYALRLDNQAFDIETSRMPINPFADRQARAEGLETLAGAARGTIFTVATAEAPFFARIE